MEIFKIIRMFKKLFFICLVLMNSKLLFAQNAYYYDKSKMIAVDLDMFEFDGRVMEPKKEVSEIINVEPVSLIHQDSEEPVVIFPKEEEEKKVLAKQKTEKLKKESKDKEIEKGDWLSRTSYGVSVGESQKPKMYFETVQPLSESLDNKDVIFTHNRVSWQDGRGNYSLGVGYRTLMYENNLLGGINSFFDWQDLHKHYRLGVGLEAFTKNIEARFNTYFGLSPKRVVEESASAFTYEKAVNGFDFELGAPIPYFPWLKFFGGFDYYDYKKSKDINGWKLRWQIKPTKALTVNVENYEDKNGGRAWKVDSRVNFDFDNVTPSDWWKNFSAQPEYTYNDLVKMMLDRVERDFTIKVERWNESKINSSSSTPLDATITIEIGRSDV